MNKTHNRMMKNFLITMSGGTTTVINSTLAGIIKAIKFRYKSSKIYAGHPGINGVLNNSIVDLTDITKEQLYRLQRTPASGFIGTTRVKPLSHSEKIRLSEIMDKYEITCLLNIGGNGTIQQSKAISDQIKNIRIIALPKTVDNDLGDPELHEVYFTPGYISTINYWKHITEMLNIENLGAHSHDKVIIAQTFGRETGFIAATARLADVNREMPLLILLPEDQRNENEVLSKIDATVSTHDRCVIVMSEGYRIGEISPRFDMTGQIMYGSSNDVYAQNLVNLCNDAGMQARSIIPTVDQRSNILYTTQKDIDIAEDIGYKAVLALHSSDNNFFFTISRNHNNEIFYQSIPMDSIQNYSRRMDAKFIATGEYDISDHYLKYLAELYDGKVIDRANFIYLNEVASG
ncbi:MAG: 6-phosphofructokinase [Candidatus Marinimicrobia bacterium]|nr:6-phosphofructokinase [Candidatus Neomarinimicrobiota bacterium]